MGARAGGTSTGPYNPNDWNFRSGGLARGSTATYNFVRGTQGWISCVVCVFDEVVPLEEWWTQFKHRGTTYSGQEVGTAGYARGTGGTMNLEVFPIQANGLPSFTNTATRLAKQLSVSAQSLWDAQTASFGGGDGPGPGKFSPRDDANAVVTLQPDTPYGFCLYNSDSTPGANFISQNRPNTRDLFWGPGTPAFTGTPWPAAQQASGGRFRPPHHVITLDKNAPGAIAGLDPRERWMTSIDGGTTWRVGLNANYYSGAADPSNDGVGLPLYMYKKNGVAGLRRGQPFYNSFGSAMATGGQTYTAVTTQTVTHLGCYSNNAVSSITITAPGGTRTASGGSLGTSGGQLGPLNSPLTINAGESYTITPSAGVMRVDSDANTALFGLSTTTNDEKAVFAYPNPQFLAVGTPDTPPPTSVTFADSNGGASLTGSGITLGQPSIIPSESALTSVAMGSGVAKHNSRFSFDGTKPFTVTLSAEMVAGTGRIFQKLANPDTGTERGYVGFKDGTGLAFARVVNGAYIVTRDNAAPTTQALYHFVYDGQSLRIHRNTVVQGTAMADARSILAFANDGSDPFVFGGKADVSDMLGGRRQVLAVNSRALSQAEINADYAAWQAQVAASGLLRWDPAIVQPNFSAAYRLINVPTAGGSFTAANSDQDCLLNMPNADMTGELELIGFRHIRGIGGRFTGATAGTNTVLLNISYMGSLDDTDQPTVFLEGMAFAQSAQQYQDGIWFGGNNAAPISQASRWPRPVLYAQYMRFDGADDDGAFHSDWIQKNRPNNGVKIDMVSGSYQWQALFLPPQEGSDGANGNGWYQGGTPENDWDRLSIRARAGRGGYAIWANWDVNGGTAFNTPSPLPNTILGDNVWVRGDSNEPLSNLAFPGPNVGTTANGYPQNISMIVSADGQTATWPAAARIQGTLRRGTPPGGDFVPDTFTGLGYVSPGYQS